MLIGINQLYFREFSFQKLILLFLMRQRSTTFATIKRKRWLLSSRSRVSGSLKRFRGSHLIKARLFPWPAVPNDYTHIQCSVSNRCRTVIMITTVVLGSQKCIRENTKLSKPATLIIVSDDLKCSATYFAGPDRISSKQVAEAGQTW